MTSEPRLAARPSPDRPQPIRARREHIRLDAVLGLGLVVILVFVLPARAVVAGLGAAGRPYLLVSVGLLVWWLVTCLHPSFRPRYLHPLVVLVLAYVGWLALAWAAGYDRGLVEAEGSGSDRALVVALGYLGIVLVAATGLRTRQAIDRVLRLAVVGAAFSASLGWVQYWFRLDLSTYLVLPGLETNQEIIGIAQRGDDFARVAGTAGHYIEFGVVTAMLLPLAIHYTLHAPRGQRQFRWVLVGLLGVAVPLAVSRSAIVAFGLAALVMLVGWSRRQRWNAVAALAAAVPVFMSVTPGLLGTIKSLFLNAANDTSLSGRTEDYGEAWAYITQRPLIGRGPGTFTPELYRLLDNQWLLSLIETGWVGALFLVGLFFGTIGALLTIRRRALLVDDEERANLALSLVAVMVTITVTAFFFDTFSFSTATTMLWLTIGITAALGTQQRQQLAGLGLHPTPLRYRWNALIAVARGREGTASPVPGDWV